MGNGLWLWTNTCSCLLIQSCYGNKYQNLSLGPNRPHELNLQELNTEAEVSLLIIDGMWNTHNHHTPFCLPLLSQLLLLPCSSSCGSEPSSYVRRLRLQWTHKRPMDSSLCLLLLPLRTNNSHCICKQVGQAKEELQGPQPKGTWGVLHQSKPTPPKIPKETW